MMRAQAFLLVSPVHNAFETAKFMEDYSWVRWVCCTYGPYPVVAYAEAADHLTLSQHLEQLRAQPAVRELDARVCKHIPGDEALGAFEVTQPEVAVLLINVDYKAEKERVVTSNLRKMSAIPLARAMWGPTDIIAVIQAEDHESNARSDLRSRKSHAWRRLQYDLVWLPKGS